MCGVVCYGTDSVKVPGVLAAVAHVLLFPEMLVGPEPALVLSSLADAHEEGVKVVVKCHSDETVVTVKEVGALRIIRYSCVSLLVDVTAVRVESEYRDSTATGLYGCGMTW